MEGSKLSYRRRWWAAGTAAASRRLGGRFTLLGRVIVPVLSGIFVFLAAGGAVTIGTLFLSLGGAIVGAVVWALVVLGWSLLVAPSEMDADLRAALATTTQERDIHAQALTDRGIQHELARRGVVLAQLRNLYVLSHDGISPEMMAGLAPLPREWVEQQLSNMGEQWRQSEYR